MKQLARIEKMMDAQADLQWSTACAECGGPGTYFASISSFAASICASIFSSSAAFS